MSSILTGGITLIKEYCKRNRKKFLVNAKGWENAKGDNLIKITTITQWCISDDGQSPVVRVRIRGDQAFRVSSKLYYENIDHDKLNSQLYTLLKRRIDETQWMLKDAHLASHPRMVDLKDAAIDSLRVGTEF